MKQLRTKSGWWVVLASLLFTGFVLTACRIESSPPITEDLGVGAKGAAATDQARNIDAGRLRAGELLMVTFADAPNLVPPFEGRIKEDGKITLMQNQDFVAAGKTAAELEKEIRECYVPKFFQNLTVTIKAQERFFYVDGQVRNPSRQVYLGDITVLGAIAAAAGPTDFAQLRKVKILRANGRIEIVNCKRARNYSRLDVKIYPGDRIFVPRKIW